MTLAEYLELSQYWLGAPPEHESLAMLLCAYTTWKPQGLPEPTEEEVRVRHRQSLEERWKSGRYMNAKQMFEAMGGSISNTGGPGTIRLKASDGDLPGIGPFPGSPAARRQQQQKEALARVGQ